MMLARNNVENFVIKTPDNGVGANGPCEGFFTANDLCFLPIIRQAFQIYSDQISTNIANNGKVKGMLVVGGSYLLHWLNLIPEDVTTIYICDKAKAVLAYLTNNLNVFLNARSYDEYCEQVLNNFHNIYNERNRFERNLIKENFALIQARARKLTFNFCQINLTDNDAVNDFCNLLDENNIQLILANVTNIAAFSKPAAYNSFLRRIEGIFPPGQALIIYSSRWTPSYYFFLASKLFFGSVSSLVDENLMNAREDTYRNLMKSPVIPQIDARNLEKILCFVSSSVYDQWLKIAKILLLIILTCFIFAQASVMCLSALCLIMGFYHVLRFFSWQEKIDDDLLSRDSKHKNALTFTTNFFCYFPNFALAITMFFLIPLNLFTNGLLFPPQVLAIIIISLFSMETLGAILNARNRGIHWFCLFLYYLFTITVNVCISIIMFNTNALLSITAITSASTFVPAILVLVCLVIFLIGAFGGLGTNSKILAGLPEETYSFSPIDDSTYGLSMLTLSSAQSNVTLPLLSATDSCRSLLELSNSTPGSSSSSMTLQSSRGLMTASCSAPHSTSSVTILSSSSSSSSLSNAGNFVPTGLSGDARSIPLSAGASESTLSSSTSNPALPSSSATTTILGGIPSRSVPYNSIFIIEPLRMAAGELVDDKAFVEASKKPPTCVPYFAQSSTTHDLVQFRNQTGPRTCEDLAELFTIRR